MPSASVPLLIKNIFPGLLSVPLPCAPIRTLYKSFLLAILILLPIRRFSVTSGSINVSIGLNDDTFSFWNTEKYPKLFKLFPGASGLTGILNTCL